MRRIGYVIEEIVEDGNMQESFDYVMRGRKRKTSRTGRYLMRHRKEVIARLKQRISDGSFAISQYKEYVINERGKERTIQSIPLEERIALNAIMRVVEKKLHRRFIADSAASIKGRGCHYLHARMLRDMKAHPDLTRYVYKFDIRKFYNSIPQDVMMRVIRRQFKDKRLIGILERCVRMLPQGMSIGLRSSQCLANLLLDYYLDHKLKDEMGVPFYRRYCDDGVVQSHSLRSLTPIVRKVHECLSGAGLEVKDNEQLFCIVNRPVDFLGYQTFGNGRVKLRKHIKQRMARRWKRVRSRKRKVSLAGSFYGMAKHAQGKHLFKNITGISMKDFSEFGLSYVASDGKKRFDCLSYPLGELQNRSIVVEDYEKDVKTKEGDGRYVVKFRNDELGEGKFFTNSDELKQMLDKIAAVRDGFPFRTTIKRQSFGQGKAKYSFT